MKTLKFLLEKEFRQIFRNKTILRLIIAVPMIQLIIIPLAADFEIKNINIAIVDHDHSTYSQKLENSILASGYFKLATYTNSYASAFSLMQKDKADLILEIPPQFERNLVRENKQQLLLAVHAINGTNPNVGASYVNRIISEFNKEIRTTLIPQLRFNNSPVIEITSTNWFNTYLNYKLYMVPGILAFLVTMIGAYMCAVNIVKEKEVGTIEQINVTPIKKYHFILGKLIPFWVIGMFVFSLGLLVVSRIIYGIVPAGSLLVLYGFLSLYLVAVLGIGLLISTYSNTQQQAMSLAFFFIMIFLLMSGLFTPIDSMPEWAKWIARFNPVTYFIEVMRMVVMKASGFNDIKKHFIIMACFAVIINCWAIFNYKKTS
jgi:ABC-2 type transport system permease protein